MFRISIYKTIPLLCFLLIISFQSQAQKSNPLKGKRVVKIPVAYAEPTGSIVSMKSDKASGAGSNWKVFSDRSGNKTYRDADAKDEFKVMEFMESFFVAEETENSLRIVKYATDAITGETNSKMEFTQTAEDYGWVSKSKVLLWSDALVDTSSHFTQKALTVKKQSALKNIATAKAKALPLYNLPSLAPESKNKNDVRIFDFLYAYKREGTSVLIGKSPEILPSNASENILGWVNMESIYNWSQVLCLEPNSDKDAVSERKTAKVKADILATQQDALLFKKGNFSGPPAKPSDDPGEKGFDSYKFRYPVLSVSDQQNQIVRTGYLTDLFDNNTGKVIISDGEQIENNKKYNKIREDWQNINLVFVIDGSEKCKEYLRPVFDAISEISSFLSDRNKNSKIRYGAVVYREYSCSPEEQFSQQPLTNVSSLKSFLARDSSANINCREQNGAPVYSALDKGLRMFDDTNQTNVVILIGAEGNYTVDEKVSDEKLKNAFAKWQCSLMAFQVVKGADPVYEAFVTQIKELTSEAAKRTSNSYAKYQNAATKTDKSKIKYSIEKPQILKLPFPENSPVPGTIVYAKMNERMKIGYFKDNLTDLIDELAKDHEKVLADFAATIKGQGAKKVNVSEAVYLLVKNGEIDPSIFALLDSKEVNQLFVEGFIPVKHDKLKSDLFTYTLFLNEDELQNLIDIFRKLSVAEATSDLRKGLVDAYKQLIVTYYGKDIKKAMNRPLSEIQKRVTGLPSKNKLFLKYTLEDLNEEKKVSRNDLQEIKNTLVDINKNLNSIRAKERYSFINNDTKFYWLPAKYLD